LEQGLRIVTTTRRRCCYRTADTAAGVLLAEQNVPASLVIADRVYVLQRCEVVRSGTAVEIGADDATMEAFLGVGADDVR